MKKVKIGWLVALFVMMSVVVVRAQECPIGEKRQDGNTPTPTEKMEQRTQRLAKALDLSPEQRAELEQFHRERAQRMVEQKAAYAAQKEKDRERMKQILTPEQFAKWEQMQQQMRSGAHHRAGGPHCKGVAPKQGDSTCARGACDKKGPQKACCQKEHCKKKGGSKKECGKKR